MDQISNIQLILLMTIGIMLYLSWNKKDKSKQSNSASNKKNSVGSNKKNSNIETWRDLPFIGNKDIQTYHRNPLNVSRKNLPIYYPISSPLEDNYFNYANSITSPKMSMLRNILRRVELETNHGLEPIIFNYAERPIEFRQPNSEKINVLANTVIDLINQFGGSALRVELINTQNSIHEETDLQSRINFDMKLKLFYSDSEQLGKKPKFDIIYIQPEFIFEKEFKTLIEDQFFKNKHHYDYRSYLSKLIVVGSEHLGFLPGRYGVQLKRSRR